MSKYIINIRYTFTTLLQVKIEKYYVPIFEVFVRMPSFHFDTDTFIEANVNHEFTFDKLGYGNIHVRWFAKKIDYSTPLFNDTSHYREEFAYFRNLSNTYRSALYDTKYETMEIECNDTFLLQRWRS